MKSLKKLFGDLTPELERLLEQNPQAHEVIELLEKKIALEDGRIIEALHALVHPAIFERIGDELYPWEMGNGAVPFVDRLYEGSLYDKAVIFRLLLSAERDINNQATGQVLREAARSALIRMPLEEKSPPSALRKALLQIFKRTIHLPKEEFHDDNAVLEVADLLCLSTSYTIRAVPGRDEEELRRLFGPNRRRKKAER